LNCPWLGFLYWRILRERAYIDFMKTTDGDLKPDPKLVRKVLGSNIRAYRLAASMSQMDLGREARLELSTIHRIESGKTDTSVSTLARLRQVLRVPWKNLLSGI
jgi:DNA-binding XRE family transcriptional regulator